MFAFLLRQAPAQEKLSVADRVEELTGPLFGAKTFDERYKAAKSIRDIVLSEGSEQEVRSAVFDTLLAGLFFKNLQSGKYLSITKEPQRFSKMLQNAYEAAENFPKIQAEIAKTVNGWLSSDETAEYHELIAKSVETLSWANDDAAQSIFGQQPDAAMSSIPKKTGKAQEEQKAQSMQQNQNTQQQEQKQDTQAQTTQQNQKAKEQEQKNSAQLQNQKTKQRQETNIQTPEEKTKKQTRAQEQEIQGGISQILPSELQSIMFGMQPDGTPSTFVERKLAALKLADFASALKEPEESSQWAAMIIDAALFVKGGTARIPFATSDKSKFEGASANSALGIDASDEPALGAECRYFAATALQASSSHAEARQAVFAKLQEARAADAEPQISRIAQTATEFAGASAINEFAYYTRIAKGEQAAAPAGTQPKTKSEAQAWLSEFSSTLSGAISCLGDSGAIELLAGVRQSAVDSLLYLAQNSPSIEVRATSIRALGGLKYPSGQELERVGSALVGMLGWEPKIEASAFDSLVSLGLFGTFVGKQMSDALMARIASNFELIIEGLKITSGISAMLDGKESAAPSEVKVGQTLAFLKLLYNYLTLHRHDPDTISPEKGIMPTGQTEKVSKYAYSLMLLKNMELKYKDSGYFIPGSPEESLGSKCMEYSLMLSK
ncbi:MAG: hypothetical protein V1822_03430 [Candidatus Micrarchaeota archaeon]